MSKIINDFIPFGGKHCITTALRQVFAYHGCSISEEMLLGIGSGLSFVYINLSSAPMIGGRSKILEFEKKISDRLNIELLCKSSKYYEKAFLRAKQLIDDNKPVFIYVDMPYLNYLSLEEESHFGGHAVVLYGYDDNHFYISDRDNSDYPIRTPKGDIAEDFHRVSYDQLERARSSKHRPFPANNKWIEMDLKHYSGIHRAILIASVQETCDAMLNPAANLLGISGICKFAKEVLKWGKFSNEKLKLAGVTNYFMISGDGGTGGGMFRKMYGDFLIESAKQYGITEYQSLGERYLAVSYRWEEIASLLWKLSETGATNLLKTLSDIAYIIADEEKAILTELSKIRL